MIRKPSDTHFRSTLRRTSWWALCPSSLALHA